MGGCFAPTHSPHPIHPADVWRGVARVCGDVEEAIDHADALPGRVVFVVHDGVPDRGDVHAGHGDVRAGRNDGHRAGRGRYRRGGDVWVRAVHVPVRYAVDHALQSTLG